MNERTPVFLRANFPQYDGGEGQRRIPKRRSLFLPGGIDLESLIWGIRLRMVALPYGWWFVPVDFFFFFCSWGSRSRLLQVCCIVVSLYIIIHGSPRRRARRLALRLVPVLLRNMGGASRRFLLGERFGRMMIVDTVIERFGALSEGV